MSRYAKLKNELMILCKSHPHEYITTMFDYYAMPSDTPVSYTHLGILLRFLQHSGDFLWLQGLDFWPNDFGKFAADSWVLVNIAI